jgi:hypothetical protein
MCFTVGSGGVKVCALVFASSLWTLWWLAPTLAACAVAGFAACVVSVTASVMASHCVGAYWRAMAVILCMLQCVAVCVAPCTPLSTDLIEEALFLFCTHTQCWCFNAVLW